MSAQGAPAGQVKTDKLLRKSQRGPGTGVSLMAAGQGKADTWLRKKNMPTGRDLRVPDGRQADALTSNETCGPSL